MALKKKQASRIQVSALGVINVEKSVWAEDEDGSLFGKPDCVGCCYIPGDDISGEEKWIQDIAALMWTTTAIQYYQEKILSRANDDGNIS